MFAFGLPLVSSYSAGGGAAPPLYVAARLCRVVMFVMERWSSLLRRPLAPHPSRRASGPRFEAFDGALRSNKNSSILLRAR
eukprot:5935650-Pyramimonas_sp.AAC.1